MSSCVKQCRAKSAALAYLSVLTGAGRDLEASEGFLAVPDRIMFSPSDFSLSTKSSTSLPLAPSLRALLGPLGLRKNKGSFSSTVKVQVSWNTKVGSFHSLEISTQEKCFQICTITLSSKGRLQHNVRSRLLPSNLKMKRLWHVLPLTYYYP